MFFDCCDFLFICIGGILCVQISSYFLFYLMYGYSYVKITFLNMFYEGERSLVFVIIIEKHIVIQCW